MDKNIKIIFKMISVLLISILFVTAGVNKIFDFNNTVKGFQTKSNYPLIISKAAIVFAILFIIKLSIIKIVLAYNINLILKLKLNFN